MKRKIINVLFGVMIVGALFTGCGKETDSPNDTNSSTDSESLMDSLYPFVTEAPEPESVAGYLEKNNIIVEGAGVGNENKLKEMELFTEAEILGRLMQIDHFAAIGIGEKIDGNNKVITSELSIGDSTKHLYGFVDRYTGICYIADKEVSSNTTIQTEEKEYDITIEFDKEEGIITVTCPSDYDGAAFLLYGTDEELLEINKENFDKFVSISEIEYRCPECETSFETKVFAK